MEAYQTLEVEWSIFNGCHPSKMVACSSGTAALHLALEALGLPPGSECVVPDYAMVSCARAVVLAGMVPIFVDCGPDLLIDVDALEMVCGKNVRAVLAVHNYGRHCNMDAIHRIATFNDLQVIEDLAEAHGILPHPSTAASCWSFYRNKIVAGEEGGAVSFLRTTMADHARCLRSVGFTEAHDYTHIPRGHNYRLANLLAMPILKSIRDYNNWVVWRRHLEAWYDKYIPAEYQMPKRDCPWVYDLRIPGMTGEQQTEMVEALRHIGIAARYGFKPLSRLVEFCTCRRFGPLDNALAASKEVIYLPLTPGSMTESSARLAGDVIRRVLGKG